MTRKKRRRLEAAQEAADQISDEVSHVDALVDLIGFGLKPEVGIRKNLFLCAG